MPTNSDYDGFFSGIFSVPTFTYGMITITIGILSYMTYMDDALPEVLPEVIPLPSENLMDLVSPTMDVAESVTESAIENETALPEEEGPSPSEEKEQGPPPSEEKEEGPPPSEEKEQGPPPPEEKEEGPPPPSEEQQGPPPPEEKEQQGPKGGKKGSRRKRPIKHKSYTV